jgi:hypothetical protein
MARCASVPSETDAIGKLGRNTLEVEPVGTGLVSVSFLSGEAPRHWPVMPGGTGVEEWRQKLCHTIGEMALPIGVRRSALSGHARPGSARPQRADRAKGR